MQRSSHAVTVLIVEDEPLIRMDLVDIIEGVGWQAVEARTADDALSILDSENEFEVIFTDIDMPGSIDGLGLAHAVSKRRPHVRIIITSGQKTPAANEMPLGALFIPKPYEVTKLISVLRDEST